MFSALVPTERNMQDSPLSVSPQKDPEGSEPAPTDSLDFMDNLVLMSAALRELIALSRMFETLLCECCYIQNMLVCLHFNSISSKLSSTGNHDNNMDLTRLMFSALGGSSMMPRLACCSV